MNIVDPAAATATYLASVPPEVHARAQAYTQGGHWYLLGGWMVGCLSALLILRTGLLTRVRTGLGGRTWLAVMSCSLIFSALDYGIELPWAWFADWRRNTHYGLTHQPVGDWFVQGLMTTAIGAVVVALFFGVLYALLRRAPKTWWLWGSGVAATFVILGMLVTPIYIAPLFNTYTPAPAGPVRDAIVALARETGTPADRIYIYNGSRQSDRYTANVAGLFGSARVAVSDTMFKRGADLSEIRAVVGHEMGHYAHMHALWGAGFLSLVSVLALFLASRLHGPVARLIGAPPVISDPAGLPALMIVLSTLVLVMTPLMASLTRLTEADADAYSFAHAREPDGFARAMMKTVDYRAATPSPLEEALFYDHPSIQHRIRAAMEWKAAHPADAPSR